jgi:hypothetical protein
MNNPYRLMLSALLLTLGIAALARAERRSTELFQKALVKESVERDLNGAIRLYQRVIDESQADRATAGEARLRMGLCFEKLGKPSVAEKIYRRIVSEPAGIASDVTRQARTNLRRIEEEKKLLAAKSIPAASKTRIVHVRETWVPQFQPARWTFSLGPDYLGGNGAKPTHGISAGFRFRRYGADRPLSWFLEARGTMPFGVSTLANQTVLFGPENDTASLSFRYQASFGIGVELPHGREKICIPEIGTGLALTSAKISYANPDSVGQHTDRTVSPYFEGGLHFFPDRLVSLLLQTRYVAAPYRKTVDIAAPPHSQTFAFPSGQWSICAALQMKIGRRKIVLKPQS